MRMALLCSCLALGACGTMNGLGQDMQAAGANLSHKATEEQYGTQPPPPPPPPPPMQTYPQPGPGYSGPPE